MPRKRLDSPRAPLPSSLQGRERRSAHDDADRERLRCRDDGARALRAVFSSYNNWLDLSETERDEWRGYFDRMLERLRLLGYTPERNPCSALLEDSTPGTGPPEARERARSTARK